MRKKKEIRKNIRNMDIIVIKLQLNNTIFLSVIGPNYYTERYLWGSREYYDIHYKILFDVLIVKDQPKLHSIFYLPFTWLFLSFAVTALDYNFDYFTAPENIKYLTFGGSFGWF